VFVRDGEDDGERIRDTCVPFHTAAAPPANAGDPMERLTRRCWSLWMKPGRLNMREGLTKQHRVSGGKSNGSLRVRNSTPHWPGSSSGPGDSKTFPL